MDVSQRLKLLPKMDKPALWTLWREHFKGAAPGQVRKELLIRVLAYRIQEQAFGGLSAVNRRRLRLLAQTLERDPKGAVPNVPAIKPGTRLVRQWQGKTYQVTVGDQGFEYDGQRYASLSQIARRITGTRWSGPLFFGLKTNRTKEARSR